MKKSNFSPTPFFKKLENLKQKSYPYIDMTVSSPIRVELPFDLNKITDKVKNEFNYWNTNPSGCEKAKSAVVDYYNQRGGNFSSEQIFLTSSTSEAYSILFKVFCNPGDVIFTPMPGYPLLETISELEHLKCYPYFLKMKRNSLGKENKQFYFSIDVDSLLSIPENTRILLLVCPHNPTGHSVNYLEWIQIVRFCEEYNLVLVVDEVFGDYVYESEKRSWKFLEQSSIKPKCPIVWLNGLSKVCGTPQIKLAWMSVYAPEEKKKQIYSALEYALDAYLSVSSMAFAFAEPLLLESKNYEKKILKRLTINRSILQKEFFSKICPQIRGGWYGAIRVGTEDEKFVLSLLKEKHILVQPGFFFDFEEDDWIVISLLAKENDFVEGIKCIKDMIIECR